MLLVFKSNFHFHVNVEKLRYLTQVPIGFPFQLPHNYLFINQEIS
jgi:hypothetical protein